MRCVIERMLNNTERPLEIVRKRLEQAGYEPSDGLSILGNEDVGYLMRFYWKSHDMAQVRAYMRLCSLV